MNESIISTNSTNDIFIELIQQYFGTSISDSFLFIAVMGIIFVIIYGVMSIFTDKKAGVKFVAGYLPTLVIDGFFSFGKYTITLPFFEHTFTHFVMTFKLIEYLFTFKLLTPLIDIINTFEEVNPDPSIIINGITWLYSFGDSILQYLVFILAAYSLLTLIENWSNKQIPYQLIVSIILGFIPVLIYAHFFSNPFHEYELSQIYITTLINFIFNASWIMLSYAFILIFISLIIIYIINLMMIQFFVSIFVIVSPKIKALDYNTSFDSIAFLFTTFYAFLFLMHPEYTWYTIMLVILIWTGFKHFLDTIVSEANHKNNERRKQSMLARKVSKEIVKLQPNNTEMTRTVEEDNLITTIIIPLLISIILIIIGFYLI